MLRLLGLWLKSRFDKPPGPNIAAMEAQPAMTTCFHCHQEHPEGHYERVVHNRTPLHGPWSAWRMAGHELVAPDNTRFTPERLKGLAWQMDASNRRNKAAARNAKSRLSASVLSS